MESTYAIKIYILIPASSVPYFTRSHRTESASRLQDAKRQTGALHKTWDPAAIFSFSFNSSLFLILSAVRIRWMAELQITLPKTERGKYSAQEATGTK